MRRRLPWSATRVGMACLVAGLLVLAGGYNYPHAWWLSRFVADVYPNSGADLVGASIVVLLIDRSTRARENEERRRQLVRECGSSDHTVASRALLELDSRGWLAEGALAGAELIGADLSRSRLVAIDLARASLIGANLEGADLSRAALVEAALSGANLSHAVLEWAILIDASITGADLRRADAAGAKLMHADLRHADLRGADLTRADLSRADLRGADLCAVNFTDAKLDAAVLDGMRYDAHTRWPAGFNPPGLILPGGQLQKAEAQ
jgi:hypothetical protein